MANHFFSVMPIFVAFFWVILLLLDDNKNNSKRFLALFLSLSVINYFVHYLYFNHKYSLYVCFDSVWVFTSLSGYPLYYYYIRLLTKDAKISLRRSWVLIPAILLAIYTAVVYILMSPTEIDTFVKGVMYHENGYLPSDSLLVKMQILRLNLFKVIFAIQLILTVYCGLRLIKSYNDEIKHFYSNTGGKDLSPIRWLLFFFLFASSVSLISNVIGKDYFVTYPWLLAIPSITHSIFLFGIGYVGYKQNFTIENFQHDIHIHETETAKIIKAQHPRLELASYEQVKKGLMQMLESEKIFTNPELRITDISTLLNTNRTYISRVINDELKTNFSELISGYRINYAKTLLSDCSKDSYSLSEISEMAGFPSDSSFYRIFKDKEGISPGHFRKKECEDKRRDDVG